MKAWRDIRFGRATLILGLLFAGLLGLNLVSPPTGNPVFYLAPLVCLNYLSALASFVWNTGRIRREGILGLLLSWISAAAFLCFA